ncbi:MAG: hypothetical protein DHS20C16_06610 [Phycisphaerae bacterium]|nr:MAG: hypothetical protein DHS20C16_06610 [Phycisphaerae bacterium]
MGLTVCSMASPPTDPVSTPLFSFDPNSPSIEEPSSFIHPDDVLRVVQPDLTPVPAFNSTNLGLGQAGDDLNAMSFSKSTIPPNEQFIFMFAVDRATTGDVPPDPALLANEVAFNVADQVARGHAAGDAFLTLSNYTVDGPVSRGQRGTTGSNTQGKNQFDEGGHDFGAEPATSSRDYSGAPQDSVNSLAYETPESARGAPGPMPAFFFSVGPMSPSLATLPGNSTADVFVHPNPFAPGISPQRYVAAADIGLQSTDDIDALVVLDHDDNRQFNEGDVIFLSLAPGSPSLSTSNGIQNISSNGAADILSARYIDPVTVVIEVFAPSASLGLIGDSDNVEGLEIIFCSDPIACGTGAGIRLVRGDWDNDGVVNINDLPEFVACMAGPEVVDLGTGYDPVCLDVFDYDFDQNVDLADFHRFQFVFTP